MAHLFSFALLPLLASASFWDIKSPDDAVYFLAVGRIAEEQCTDLYMPADVAAHLRRMIPLAAIKRQEAVDDKYQTLMRDWFGISDQQLCLILDTEFGLDGQGVPGVLHSDNKE